MELCFATNNQNKLKEVQQLLGDEFQVKGLKEIGCNVDIPETGETLEENSLIKASYVKDHFGLDCFADDTGLEVEALNGAPGVYSARYAGGDGDSQANISLLMKNLGSTVNRKARFRTVITLLSGSKKVTFTGVVNGTIPAFESGSEGFGYDPVFIPDGYNSTFAEMSLDKKNLISHRGIAIRKLTSYLKSADK